MVMIKNLELQFIQSFYIPILLDNYCQTQRQEHQPHFTFKEEPFTQALMEAYADSSKEVFLILEELSRGNVAAIFGDIFQLLDRDSHFVSRYPIRNKNIADKIPSLLTDEVKLPSNFNIICTVNMNDQNVFPMDTAFKRRFDWEYISIDPVIDKTDRSTRCPFK